MSTEITTREYIHELFRSYPDTEEISLRDRCINDLGPLIVELASFPKLTKLDLSHNSLRAFSWDVSSWSNVKQIDLSSNFFKNVNNFVSGLQKLPALRDLVITISEDEKDHLLESLPKLSTLNGVNVRMLLKKPVAEVEDIKKIASGIVSTATPSGAEALVARNPIAPLSMTQTDLESVALLYGAMTELYGEVSRDVEESFKTAFDEHVQIVMKQLSKTLRSTEDSFVKQSAVLLSKYRLYDVCEAKALSFMREKLKGSEDLYIILVRLSELHSEFVSQFPQIVQSMLPYYIDKIEGLKSEVVRAQAETSELLEAAEMLEKEAMQHAEEMDRTEVEFEKQAAELQADNRRLRQENEQLVARLREAERLNDRLVKKGGIPPPPPTTPPPPLLPDTKAVVTAGSLKSLAYDGTLSTTPLKTPSAAASTIKDLTLNQLKDYIEGIYTSKEISDKKSAELHQPRETVEQHLYTYLNQKYGLKSLIVGTASSILKAVVKYTPISNEIAVFGKIIHHEIDEEFRLVQAKFQQTIKELLKIYLKSKMPLKSDEAISGLVKERCEGYVIEEEWVDIIRYLFDPATSGKLIQVVKETIAAAPTPLFLLDKKRRGGAIASRASALATSAATRRRRATSGAAVSFGNAEGFVKYSEFIKVLLDNQLAMHESFLGRFRKHFQSVDLDNDGILSEEEFRQLAAVVIGLLPSHESVERLLLKVDPYGNSRITISDIILLLADELVGKAASPTEEDIGSSPKSLLFDDFMGPSVR